MMEAICSSETPVHTRSTRRHNREDGILHSHHGKNLKSDITRYKDRIVREAIETALRPYNINREGNLCLSKSLKPLIGSLETFGT
jgi:hypothetical protein